MGLFRVEERDCLDYPLIGLCLTDYLHSCARGSSTRGNVDERQ